MADKPGVKANAKFVINMTNEDFGGHVILREISAHENRNGSWSVECIPIVAAKPNRSLREVFRGVPTEGEVVYKALIEKGCRHNIPGNKPTVRDVVLYESVDPADIPTWWGATRNGMMSEIAKELQMDKMSTEEVLKEKTWGDQELQRFLAGNMTDEFIASRVKKLWEVMLPMMVQGQHPGQGQLPSLKEVK